MPSVTASHEIHDLVGVGFGPAAIAVAVVLAENDERLPAGSSTLRASYVERAGSAVWQPNLLLPGTDIQHHYLRDLATPRNPRSRFTFPNYLTETGQFYHFTQMGHYVSRAEWSEYLLWVARQLDQDVRYNAEVVEVAPVSEGDKVVAAVVRCRDVNTGETFERLASNILVSSGHQAYMPEVLVRHAGERVFHSGEYLSRIAGRRREDPLRIAVVGAGQTAGEIFLHLAQSFPNAQIYCLARNSGLRMYELGHFSNEAYFPDETEYFYGLDAHGRQRVFGEQRATNYAAVDPDLSRAMYQQVYEDRYFGTGRLHVRKRTDITSVTPGTDGLRLSLREVYRGTADELDVDLIIACTGFREPKIPGFLEPFERFVLRDEADDPDVTWAHRLRTADECAVGLYLNGITEWRHGINSATSFSTLAIRAGRIVADLEDHGGQAMAVARMEPVSARP